MTDREMDAALAETVYGLWVVHNSWPCGWVPDGGYEAASREDDLHSWYSDRGPVYAERDGESWPPQLTGDPLLDEEGLLARVEPVPFYSTTWEGLGLVIEAMRELGFECDLITWAGGTNSAKFGRPWDVPSSSQWVETAATAPRAVAMAALRALGQEVGE